jgi:EpsI family protein
MRNISRRTMVLSALMGSASLAAHEVRPRKMLTDELGKLQLATSMPAELPGWAEDKHTAVVLANPGTEALLSQLYTELLTRAYIDENGRRIMLSVAYGANQSDDKAVHYPDACYPAQGFVIGKKTVASLDLSGHTVPAYQMLAKLGPRNEHITFWAMVGDQPVLGPVRHKLTQLSYGFRGYIPDGLIFRVSTIDDDADRAKKTQIQFLKALYSSVDVKYRSRIFGA